MRWALNQITLHGGSRQGPQAPDDLSRELAAVRAGGWRALELWIAHWDVYIAQHGLPAARRLLDDAGLVAAGGCGPLGSGSLFFSRGDELHRLHDTLRQRLEQCQALGAPHLVIAPGFGLPERPVPADLDRAAHSLRATGEAAARHGIRLGIEFLAGARLVSTVPAAVALAERIAHPNVGIVVDTYHLYAGASKAEDLDLLRDDPGRLSFVHVSDVDRARPRDLWTVLHRTLPGAGGIPNRALLDGIKDLGYNADVSLELFSPAFEEAWVADAAAAARRAYERCTALEPDRP